MTVWVCPDSVDTFTMPRGQALPDFFLSPSIPGVRGQSPRWGRKKQITVGVRQAEGGPGEVRVEPPESPTSRAPCTPLSVLPPWQLTMAETGATGVASMLVRKPPPRWPHAREKTGRRVASCS